jgi:hypothetical protein
MPGSSLVSALETQLLEARSGRVESVELEYLDADEPLAPSASVGAGAGWKRSLPSGASVNTPSSTNAWA